MTDKYLDNLECVLGSICCLQAPILCASHTEHGSFRDSSECISCITQPKYDHFGFLSRLAPTEYLDILGQYAWQACNDGEVCGGWITFHRRCIYVSNYPTVTLQVFGSAGRKWLVAFLPLALSAHQVVAALLAVQLSGHWRRLPP